MFAYEDLIIVCPRCKGSGGKYNMAAICPDCLGARHYLTPAGDALRRFMETLRSSPAPKLAPNPR